jgi:hypothetical protein
LLHCSLFKFTLVINSVLSIWKRLPPSSRSVYRDFCMLKVCSSNLNCPSGKCASGNDVASSDADVFGTKTASLNHISYCYFLDY